MLQRVIEGAPSLVFAADTVHFTQAEYNGIIGDWAHISHPRLSQAFTDRASRELVGSGIDLLEQYPRFWPRVTTQWRDSRAKSTYLRELVDRTPRRLGETLAALYREELPPWRSTARPFNMATLEMNFDPDLISELLAALGDAALADSAAKNAAEAFQKARNTPTASTNGIATTVAPRTEKGEPPAKVTEDGPTPPAAPASGPRRARTRRRHGQAEPPSSGGSS